MHGEYTYISIHICLNSAVETMGSTSYLIDLDLAIQGFIQMISNVKY